MVATRGTTVARRLGAAFAIAASLLFASAAAAAGDPADSAATAAYVSAYYELQRAINADAPARVTAAEALAARIESECPGAFAHVPVEPRGAESPRQFGESIRVHRQLADLREELELALTPPELPPEHAALSAFVGAAAPLRWSDPAIDTGVADFLRLISTESAPREVDFCADVAAWAASGYRTLSAATKSLGSLSPPPPVTGPVTSPDAGVLRQYEDAATKALVAQIETLRLARTTLERPLEELDVKVEATLGLAPREGEETSASGSPTGAKVLAHGRTAAGERFTVSFVPASPGRRGCSVTIESGHGGTNIGAGGGCSFRGRAAEASVNCSEGLLTVQANTLPGARKVRLLLSDGRTITTAAIRIPAADGGPAGLYYQVVRGPKPIPVSLTELSSSGRPLRTDRLPAVRECTRSPLKFLPGGIRTLVSMRVPNGPRFQIVAQRYRFLGHVHLDLTASVAGESPSGGASFSIGHRSQGAGLHGRAARAVFEPQSESGCDPEPYTIVFGILHRRHDTVLARTAAGLVPLHLQPVPASLHANGVLAWGAFSPPAAELRVDGPRGAVLLKESLSARALREQCEGEAEGPLP